jgi:ABC-2 type transport system permease protein
MALGAFSGARGLGLGGLPGWGTFPLGRPWGSSSRPTSWRGWCSFLWRRSPSSYATVFLSTTASALAAVATLLLMRLLVAFPALTPFLLTTYLDLHLRPEAAAIGLPLLLLYTLGFGGLALLTFERKDL